MALELLYEDSVSVYFPDDYRWLDSARFTITGADERMMPADVLARLLVDTHYVNAYQYANCVAARVHEGHRAETNHSSYLRQMQNEGLTPETDPMRDGYPAMWRRNNSPGPEHGPYLMSHIDVSTFETVDATSARAMVISWLDDDWEPPRSTATPLKDDLQVIMQQVEAAPTIYHLRDLGEYAHHASGFVVDDPYLELVLIDLEAGRLHLIAGGGD